MKTILSITFLSALTASVFAQGSLTPPAGVPAPVFKTLDQIYDKVASSEARTPLVAGQPGVTVDANGTINISQPGSYYLTGNLTLSVSAHGITISSDDVTVDLNGFTIKNTSTSTTGSGITILGTSRNNLTIRNGHIHGNVSYNSSTNTYTGGGFANGIAAPSAFNFSNVRVSNISVSGCYARGIDLGSLESNSVESCSVRQVNGFGIIAATVTKCSVEFTNLAGINANSVSDCTARSTVSTGIVGKVVQNSTGVGLTGGIFVTGSVTNSYGEVPGGGNGIDAGGTASFCRGKSGGGFAISAGIAIGCTTAGGTINSPEKHLGTP